MTMSKKALVCDDHASRVDDWVGYVESHLTNGWEVSRASGAELARIVGALGEIEDASRNGQSRSTAQLDTDYLTALEMLDGVDLVILDSDLTPSIEDGRAMGESSKQTLRNQLGDTVARQMRSYTSVGFIAVVNMFWGNYPAERVFDLTMMQGWRSFADLHISEAELQDEALWTGESAQGEYHPWSWPVLASASEWVRRSEEAVRLDDAVLPALGLDIEDFSPRQRDLFREGADMTFRQIANSELGFRYPGAFHSEAEAKRMSASVVRRWISRTLLAGQNVVADAPHLLTRFSPILGDNEPNIEVWNSITKRGDRTQATLDAAHEAKLQGIEHFADRVVYSLARIRTLLSQKEQLWLNPPEVVFAEDTGDFVSDESAVAFQTDLPGPYSSRHVQNLDYIDYEPSPRLLA